MSRICKTLSFLFLLFITHSASAQYWEWIKSGGGTSDDYSRGVAAGQDAVYITGAFKGNSQYGNGSHNVKISSSGDYDIFLLKYNPDGSLVWAVKAGGTSEDQARSVCVDKDENIYVTGWFSGSATFGSGSSSKTITSSGGYDIFIAKYDSSGRLIWVKGAGGSNNDQGHHLVVQGSNLYVAGNFYNSATIGGTSVSSRGGNDVFIAKFDTSGKLSWVTTYGGTGNDDGAGLTIDLSGNIYFNGFFASTAYFGSGTSMSLTSRGGQDICIGKVSSSGSFMWIRQGGGSGDDYGYVLACDSSAHIYCTGPFSGKAIFKDTNGDSLLLTSNGGTDLYLVNYDSSGNLIGGDNGGGSGDDAALDIEVDAYGHVYLSGYFRGSAYFGYKKWHLTAIGSSNAFVLRYQPAGPLDWAFAVGSTGDGAGNGIAINHGHELYIAGPFQDSVGLNTSAGFQSAGSAGGNDVFLAKLSICEPLKGNVIKASGSQTICYHSLPPKIVEDTFVTGGDHWFSYSWQMSTDGVHFYEPQSYIYNDQNYLQAESLDTTTWFRMVMISGTGCGEKISDTVKITVLRPITGNYINAEQTTCYNEAPQALTTLDTITGDSLNFLWESSTDGTHYNIIADATKEQYQPGALLSTTYFRRVIVQGGGCGNTDTSNVIKINVLPALTGNSIDSSQKICIGSAPDTLRTASAAQGGNGSFTYIWQSSTVSATDSFQNIANSNTENYAPGVLYQTTWYRRKAVSDCGTLISNAIQITADSCGTGISLSANPESALISISPNPFTNQAKLHCTFTLRSQIQIDILSLQGNVVEKIYQGPAVSQDYILDGSALNPGVYVVRIQGNQLLEYRKILVIK